MSSGSSIHDYMGTDANSNMLAEVKHVSFKGILCLSHMLQLVVDALSLGSTIKATLHVPPP